MRLAGEPAFVVTRRDGFRKLGIGAARVGRFLLHPRAVALRGLRNRMGPPVVRPRAQQSCTIQVPKPRVADVCVLLILIRCGRRRPRD